MSKNDKNALNNAGKIIERFGGIRPMAAKINTPVTTVQGWKKRDVIPAARREQILDAASQNDIDLSDLMNGSGVANQNAEPAKEKAKPQSKSKRPSKEKVVRVVPEVKGQETERSAEDMKGRVPTPSSHDSIIEAIEENNRKTMAASAWIATGLILLAAGVAAFLLWPSVQDNAAQMEAQSEKLVMLEDEVKNVDERASFFKNIVPDNIQEKMDDLQNQAANIQNTVEQLSERADEISNGVFSADAGPISQRLMVLEEQMAAFSGTEGNFGALIGRIKALEETVSGQEQIKNSVEELRGMVTNLDGQTTLNEDLAEAQDDEESALSQTLEGVSGNDLKAAAMLIAFSQLRDSLNREAPFENDLALLEKLAGEDNPELQQALDRLAPHADGGVLTAKGLSGEFKGLAGDIVVSSLKGEDISFKEKAKARLGNLMQVEKEGELVSGTETQVTVAKAQKLLDEGNIQGAITELQSLEGEAAQTAQPFIEEAKVSLLAEKAQELLGSSILSKITSQLPVSGALEGLGVNAIASPNEIDGIVDPATALDKIIPKNLDAQNFDINEVKKNLESAVPLEDKEVIRDEESGVTILPRQQGFKGFSGGQ